LKIEVCVSVHYFQHRFCWELSSILQQVDELPEIVINAAYVENTGKPTTHECLDFFEARGLRVKHTPYPDQSIFQFRGFVRNKQLAETDADWVLFTDADMVFPPQWFSLLKGFLEGPFKDSGRCLFTGRRSTILEPTSEFVNFYTYPTVVRRVWKKARRKLKSKRKSNVGAGFCQIARVAHLREHFGGLYINPKRNPDWSWDRMQRAASDIPFRRMLGREKIPLPWLVHLQHRRDRTEGHHIEEQR